MWQFIQFAWQTRKEWCDLWLLALNVVLLTQLIALVYMAGSE